jgi:hypothetical protein
MKHGLAAAVVGLQQVRHMLSPMEPASMPQLLLH